MRTGCLEPAARRLFRRRARTGWRTAACRTATSPTEIGLRTSPGRSSRVYFGIGPHPEGCVDPTAGPGPGGFVEASDARPTGPFGRGGADWKPGVAEPAALC